MSKRPQQPQPAKAQPAPAAPATAPKPAPATAAPKPAPEAAKARPIRSQEDLDERIESQDRKIAAIGAGVDKILAHLGAATSSTSSASSTPAPAESAPTEAAEPERITVRWRPRHCPNCKRLDTLARVAGPERHLYACTDCGQEVQEERPRHRDEVRDTPPNTRPASSPTGERSSSTNG